MTEPTEPDLRIDRHIGFAVLTLNRPAALNALSSSLRRGLIRALDAADHDSAIRAVVLTGAGRAFCAGLDLKELASKDASVEDQVADENVVAAIARLSKPVIGAINGLAVTGGLEIALACDFLIASDQAGFVDSHVAVGLAPGWGLSQRLSRIVGLPRAKEMSLSGKTVPADLACRWGLVNHVVPAAELMPAALALAARIAGNDPGGVAIMKALIDRGFDLSLVDALEFEADQARRRNSGTGSNNIEFPGGRP